MSQISRVLPIDLVKFKQKNKRFSVLTAYDAAMAALVEQGGIEVILVGDSCGNVVAGHSTTLPMTMDQMIYHTQCVARGTSRALIVGDMPFMSYHESHAQAKANAGRFLKEADAQAVKIEVLPNQVDTLKSLVDVGIPVMGHIGFTPQSVFHLGGYKLQGKTAAQADAMLALALEVEAAGAFSLVLEMVPAVLAKRITEQLRIPTIGIGAGPDCDGQVLVLHDLIGLSRRSPKFSKQYAQVGTDIVSAISAFNADVEAGRFPGPEHGF